MGWVQVERVRVGMRTGGESEGGGWYKWRE